LTISPAVKVTAFDALGNVATGFVGNVTIAITTGTGTPGAVLLGTLTQPVASGVATFPDLSIEKAGTGYTLSATSTVTGTTSATFDILPAAASQLGFLVQPTNTAVNASITPAVQVAAQDAFGNTVTTFAGSVTVVIGTDAGSGGGSVLSGTTTATVGNGQVLDGVATFGNLSINKTGVGFTLSFTSTGPSLTGVISSAFNITP
jgi:hypothetical protein